MSDIDIILRGVEKKILARLLGRLMNNLMTSLKHPEEHVKSQALLRAKAYSTAISDVESIFKDFDIEVKEAAFVARELFSTKEEQQWVAAILKMPVEFLFPEVPDGLEADPQLQPVRNQPVRSDPADADEETSKDPTQ
jgi:hypothetical protein